MHTTELRENDGVSHVHALYCQTGIRFKHVETRGIKYANALLQSNAGTRRTFKTTECNGRVKK